MCIRDRAYITATTSLIYLVDSLYFLLTIGELALDDIRFYPEGGHIIKGLPTRVAFEAKDNYGRNVDRKSTRLNSSHITRSRMPSSA